MSTVHKCCGCDPRFDELAAMLRKIERTFSSKLRTYPRHGRKTTPSRYVALLAESIKYAHTKTSDSAPNGNEHIDCHEKNSFVRSPIPPPPVISKRYTDVSSMIQTRSGTSPYMYCQTPEEAEWSWMYARSQARNYPDARQVSESHCGLSIYYIQARQAGSRGDTDDDYNPIRDFNEFDSEVIGYANWTFHLMRLQKRMTDAMISKVRAITVDARRCHFWTDRLEVEGEERVRLHVAHRFYLML
ncbi:mitochondrial fission regulator 1-like [Babesia caballi]|uniref:Mitochondrial fission regulator 1-like n=1 Tax=Babesia caballi TaxID=5871 RepID=A0AAV4LV29_BABCB|nr:mitochondrial fission regulator 1-like [Babesia caballi]